MRSGIRPLPDPPHETVSEEELEGALALIDGLSREDLEGAEFTDTNSLMTRPTRSHGR
jgi:hypothetical protein